jgi:hypothetical protein
MMEGVLISGVAALSGSAIGGLVSAAATWMAHRHQDRRERTAMQTTRRERIFTEFMEQASRAFADALVHQLEDPSKLVPLFATIGKLRLFASSATVDAAEEVMDSIVNAYYSPPVAFDDRTNLDKPSYDVLRIFIDACQHELKAEG